MGKPLEVLVWRSDAPGGRYQRYQVARQPSQTVLDVVSTIQRELDPSLAFRFACRVGVCGSCAMIVNGIARWTCRTHVDEVVSGNRLEIAPLANLPVIKDLACDMQTFFDKWSAADGVFQPAAGSEDAPVFAQVSPQSPARKEADAGIECIGCGVCYSECDTVSNRADYLGPAALNRAWTLQNDVRDQGNAARYLKIAGDAGCHACHSQLNCSERCPKHLDPAHAIARLKRHGHGLEHSS
jgi:fumarate reductase iron-sulfur subunit